MRGCAARQRDLAASARVAGVTPDDVAAVLRTSKKAIYAKIERGQLPGVVRIGRRVLIRPCREDALVSAAPVAVVTGGARRLGRHLCVTLASRGRSRL